MKGFKSWFSCNKVPEISAQELQALIENALVDKKTLQIVDVRSSMEWRQSRIKAAVNLPIHRFNEENIQRLNLNQDSPIVLICLSAHRSIPAVRRLHSMGFSNAVQLKGGMKQWWKLNGPTVNGHGF